MRATRGDRRVCIRSFQSFHTPGRPRAAAPSPRSTPADRDARRTRHRAGAGCAAGPGRARLGRSGRPRSGPPPAPATSTTVSDGTASAAQMTYNADNSGSGTWTFTATAQTSGTIKVPYILAGPPRVVRGDGTTRHDRRRRRPEHTWSTTARSTAAPARPTASSTAGSRRSTCTQGQTYGFRLSPARTRTATTSCAAPSPSAPSPTSTPRSASDNRQWTGATTCPRSGTRPGTLTEAGETRWYRFPVVPGEQATVNLTDLPADDDVALYGDIGAAFDQLSSSTDLSQLAAASAQGAPGSEHAGAGLPGGRHRHPDVQRHARSSPRRSTRPHIYAPRIYAPRDLRPAHLRPAHLRAPHLRAGRLRPEPRGRPGLQRGVLGRPGPDPARGLVQHRHPETRPSRRPRATPTGYFYVRVQGHTDLTPAAAFHVARTLTDTAAPSARPPGRQRRPARPRAADRGSDPAQPAPVAPSPANPRR